MPAVSLFPFLSILACVIGTLTLMISALALGQMATPELDSANQMHAIERRQSSLREEISRFDQQPEPFQKNASASARALASTRTQLNELERRLASLKAQKSPDTKLPSAEKLVLDAKTLETRIRSLETELASRRSEAKTLREQIAQRKKPPEEAIVKIRPGGSGVGIRPIFIECTNTSVVIHEKDKPVRVRTADIAASPEFLDLARRVAKQPNSSIIFLIRDNGLSTYARAKRVATDNYARNGKLPVIGQGKLDLSLFRKK